VLGDFVAADRDITLDVVRGYLNGPYLAYLLVAGKTGIKSDAVLRSDGLSIRFEGLKKVPGRSGLGNFHYVPLMFCGTSHIHGLEFTCPTEPSVFPPQDPKDL
jgi:hypothetical protein